MDLVWFKGSSPDYWSTGPLLTTPVLLGSDIYVLVPDTCRKRFAILDWRPGFDDLVGRAKIIESKVECLAKHKK